jgi:uncharacterized protein
MLLAKDVMNMDSATSITSPGPRPNRLIHEKSPYLLQHAFNPVDWHAWGAEAFEAARREDKPIFLSIGYSTCHWCHVMEHESFEDAAVAALMNDAFICIKVDREERPDIDNAYMKVCQMVTGSGGWPLTIVMTSDQKPFFAGTYIPKEDRFGRMGMMGLIPRIQEYWRLRREEVAQSCEEILAALEKASAPSSGGELDESALEAAFEELSGRFDGRHGGFGTAPKFPTPHTLLFLLRYWKRHGEARALEMAERTLDGMRRGGIYDHIGFGFHRYSTDASWLVPHFEKMLYDQALLTLAYTEAYQATRKEEYGKTAREILAYVARDLTSAQGGFFSAEDADSEGEEGKFYLWTEREIDDALGREEAELVKNAFGLAPDGNFTDQQTGGTNGQNILHQPESAAATAARLGISPADFESRWQAAREKLFALRETRVHPHKDDKILADWNGLMIAAFARAAQILGRPLYHEIAGRAADFILTHMRSPQGGLLHRYREGEAAVEGHLDDYAFMTWGLIELYEATFKTRHLEAALDLNDRAIWNFWDDQNGGFYFTAKNSEKVLVRSKEIYDGAVPSGNSVMMLNLLRLGRMTGRSDLEEMASQTARAFGGAVRQSSAAYTQLMVALDFAVGPAFEVVISGNPQAEDTRAMLEALRGHFVPNKVVLLRSDAPEGGDLARLAAFTQSQTSIDGKATAYICKHFRCNSPTTDIATMLRNLSSAP